ncbi:hypothetical protein [Micromonospora globispora]|uniref:hypothetical protein n=1 Tax=Micromonospora globispora TaxID=1450148 RepID=UPI000F4E0BDC|nr:hypothetical protein [Micromonospora globispora]
MDTVKMRLLRVGAWLVGGLTIAGLGYYFFRIGLDQAGKVSSAAGLFIGIIGLGISGYGVFRASQSADHASDGQVVSSSQTSGDVFQARRVKGSIRISSTPSSRRPIHGSRTKSPTTAQNPPSGGQAVRGSEVDGAINQFDEIGGDIEVDR